MSKDCLFCKIAQGEITPKVVYKTPQVLVFEDIQPQAPIHWLLIHTTHTASVSETEDDTIFSELLGTARDVAKAHTLNDYRLVFNTGKEAGQSVFHMHLHLLGGRPFTWPPG